ncbi:pseudouridylate synthase 7 homolog [Diadema setosum]|uniref:pseudouridylate synthase 7 homolog n=1 Tax=Diadema setosum TaxID=31175 RepID=UPI003B3B705C
MGADSRDEEMDEEGGVEESGSSAGASSTKRRKQVLVGLKETDVGILEYRSHHAGIAGILKQRYRDFMVNEIDVDGKIVHLTDMKCPEKKSILPFDVNEVLTEEDQERLSVLAKGQDKSAECVIEVTEDKERRTKVHQAIRHLFPKLESTTLEDGGQKTIRVKKGGGGKHGRSRWPKDKPNYCRFVLYKENMDVYEALNIIAKYLHIGPHHFQYAGSKDKRGVTVQEVTIHRVDGQRLAQLNKVLRCIRLGNFRYVHKPLNLGELSGNHFVIILRMVKASQEQIDTAMSALRDSGFINYFGMQRFGNSLIATYLVGRALLLSQWQTAVDLILKPREEDQEDEGWRRHWMETRDAQATLAMLPNHRRRSVEQQLLRGLLKSKNDYLAAFSSIPRNTRLIYVHSYQSYIWNQITSRRLKQYGMSPVVGDLASKASIEDEDSEVPVVEYVTEENIGQFTIFDVILPLPGYSVKYPLHEAAEWYTEKLAQDGLTNEMLKHPVRDLSLTGAYRKCVVKPKNVDW